MPASVNRKLLVAFVGIVVLLVTVGVLGLRVLGDANDRVDTLGNLQERTGAYQTFQADATVLQKLVALRAGGEGTSPIFNITTSLTDVATIDEIIQDTLIQSNLASNITQLPFVPPAAEQRVLSQIQLEYSQFSGMIVDIGDADGATQVLDATGNRQAQQLQRKDEAFAQNVVDFVLQSNAETYAKDLVELTQDLVDTASDDTAALIAVNTSAYADSQHLFIGVAAGSVVVALLLGFLISRSLVGPIRKMDIRLAAIASGDFSGHVDVPNRDELGALATNVNRMNDRLGRLYGELESASRHKSEFLANMSHELRTPLNAVIGFSEVLQDRLFGDLNDKQAEYVADIHASGRHLLELINDILDLSKIEAGRMDLQVTPFVFSDVAQNAVALSRERATREGIALGLDVDPDIGVIEADARMVKQVLFNLLTNALKFTDRGGHIGVSAHADGDDVVVSVRDDGVGIAPEDQARIFEEFQQVGASRLQEGTGLGLAISRRFIELHGGSLRVESAPGHGSTFTFTIPRTQSTASSPVREDEALMAPQGGTRTQPPDVTSAGDPRRLQER